MALGPEGRGLDEHPELIRFQDSLGESSSGGKRSA